MPVRPVQGLPVVLVVDDDPDILDSFQLLLQSSLPGTTVLTAPDGPSALDILKRGPVDLVITDFQMPRMNGFEFLQQALRLRPGLPCILVTAFPDLAGAAQMVSHVSTFARFAKPVDPETFVSTTLKALASATH